MKEQFKRCKDRTCNGNIEWDFEDIDKAWSPEIGTCDKCGIQYRLDFTEERIKWCEEMNSKLGNNPFKYIP